jgi:transposase InsO family protein
MPDAALLAAIRDVLAASPFHGEGHRKVWARLRHRGILTSLRRALRLMRQNDLLAPARTGSARGLAMRHDHGSQYMSDHFQKELRFLGIESSPAFVRAPEGNGCAERFIRTLKENLLWLRTFDTIEELRQALLAFRDAYNTTWLIQRHGFVTPAECRKRQLQPTAQAV